MCTSVSTRTLVEHTDKEEMPLVTSMFLIVDASEASEVSIYLVNGRDAPPRMKMQIESSGKRTFNDIYEDVPATLDGLVDEYAEDAEDRAEEVWEWLKECRSRENTFNPTDERVVITHTISIAQM
jgi:hypothetical protein